MSVKQEEGRSVHDLVVENYLKSAPYMGNLKVFSLQNKDTVKELAKGPGDNGWKMAVYNSTTKQWGTRLLSNIPRLIKSGLWEPVGVQNEAYSMLCQSAMAKHYFKNEEKQQKINVKVAAATEKDEAERAAAIEERKRRKLEQEASEALKAMLPATQDEIAKVASLGVTQDAVNFSTSLHLVFGPLAGMSAEGRVLRWMGFKRTAARVKAYEETGSKWLSEQDLVPYYSSSNSYWANALNKASRERKSMFDDKLASRRATKDKSKRMSEDPHDRESLDVLNESNPPALSKQDTSLGSNTPTAKPKPTTLPSIINYRTRCQTCKQLVTAQFTECMCTNSWVPCYSCTTFVAMHQKCVYEHEVEYMAQSSFFTPCGAMATA